MSLTYDNLLRFVRTLCRYPHGHSSAAIGGPGTKVFPPTYGTNDGPAYAIEWRIITDADGRETRKVESVVLDSVAAQAHELSNALLAAWEADELKLPLIGVDFTKSPGLEDFGVITDLQCPHRIYDAITRDSLDGDVPFRYGKIGRAVTEASTKNATALYIHTPAALVFGAWDSTGPKGGRGSKFERALTSEIVAADFRVQEVLVHNHFRFCHTIRGMSGPILMSRGRVVTHPFDRDDRAMHPGHTPTHSTAVRTWMVRVRSTSTCTDSTTTPSSPSSSEPLVWGMLAPLLLDA